MRLHVVDGTYELYRAHYSKRPDHRDPEGHDRKAVVGLASSMLALLGETKEAVTHIAIAFDNPIRSFRNDLFAGYKDDTGVPEDLRAQFGPAEDAMRALGILVWSMSDHEADDALGSAAKQGITQHGGPFDQVRILSPDKDMGQMILGESVVQVDRMRDKVIDESVFRATRGIAPSSLPDFLGLVGDSADGIPGLPGFGEKTAAALLACYGSLEEIPADFRSWKPKVRGAEVLAKTLAAHRQDALLYRKLATLITDLPLDLSATLYKGVPKELFTTWCDALAVGSLRERGLRRVVTEVTPAAANSPNPELKLA